MAHNKIYGICESKCQVRIPRTYTQTFSFGDETFLPHETHQSLIPLAFFNLPDDMIKNITKHSIVGNFSCDETVNTIYPKLTLSTRICYDEKGTPYILVMVHNHDDTQYKCRIAEQNNVILRQEKFTITIIENLNV